MTYILCLAHYCEVHGPTPLMVTEGIQASCSICHEDAGAWPDSRMKLSASPNGRSASLPVAESESKSQRAALLRSSTTGSATTISVSPVDTPQNSSHSGAVQHQRRDSSFRRTYDETVTKSQGPCDNCAMTLPRRQKSGKGTVDFNVNTRGPTLRTRAPAERVFGASGQASPPNSQTSSDTDGERDDHPRARKRGSPSVSSRDTSRSTSSASDRTPFHVHFVDYTSTHDPILAESFRLIRASCLRTLSLETLPRAPATAPTSPLSTSSPAFVTAQNAGSVGSGGSIFFGDSRAGYTTAYIFRIPDVHARGHKRVYAFLALSTHRERLAMKTFAVVSNTFRDLATWIQQLAEAEAERVAEASPIGNSLYGGGYPSQQPAIESSGAADRGGGSSFLTGGSGFTRRMGVGGSASAPKARGLAEIVGQPDIFLQLHSKFVHLLFEVSVTLSS